MTNNIAIEETPNVFDDNILNVFGNQFKSHEQGMAEWLKNSVDAYRTSNTRQDKQYIVFRFTDQEVKYLTIECIDFVGMTKLNIEKAFMRWGDPTASKKGTKIKTYGGHGNGGKFYMREMFNESRFITYKEGLLNIFGFNENKKYGYAKGFQDKKVTPKEAMKIANIIDLSIPKEIKNKILTGDIGFTVVLGVAPEGVRSKFKVTREMEKFKNHPQSRGILMRTNVSVIYNGNSLYALLKPDEIEPLEGFIEPCIVYVPEKISIRSGSENIIVQMANKKYPPGKLTLRTSSEALSRGSKLGELNRIDILGEVGSIGSYQLFEMGVTGYPYAAFIYGEFGPAHEDESTILEDPQNDCVSNDRAKLVPNDTTRALVEWIAQEVDKLATKIAALEREKQKASQKEITSKFNDVLNEWKNKHMRKIMSDLFGGAEGGTGEGTGGTKGTTVIAPPNGFDFKYPQAEIEINAPEKITLKVSVPQALPIGATIFFSSNSKKVFLENNKFNIKSDYLKSTPDGQEVAFININILGSEINAEALITATAGKLSTSMKVVVIKEKENKSGKSFPQVLLSDHNPDPLGIAPGGMLTLGERDPVVYQRPQDVVANIYWINTASPMASRIYDRFTFDSVQWRNFLFERYVDIFVKEAVHELYRKDFNNFNADAVDQKIAEVVMRVHQSANDDLEQFLFDESYVIKKS